MLGKRIQDYISSEDELMLRSVRSKVWKEGLVGAISFGTVSYLLCGFLMKNKMIKSFDKRHLFAAPLLGGSLGALIGR